MPSPESEPELTEEEIARRHRAAELLGDVLPETAADDTDEGWGEHSVPTSDEEYLRDVPPHHG